MEMLAMYFLTLTVALFSLVWLVIEEQIKEIKMKELWNKIKAWWQF